VRYTGNNYRNDCFGNHARLDYELGRLNHAPRKHQQWNAWNCLRYYSLHTRNQRSRRHWNHATAATTLSAEWFLRLPDLSGSRFVFPKR